MGKRKDNLNEPDLVRPSAARIYDFLLGGFHNFEVDRAAARRITEALPDMPRFMRANRAFLRRVVRFLTDQGIDQFLDLGSGIPTVGNVHEVAQQVNPSARVVYVDNESVAVTHSRAILQDNPKATVIQADMRQPEVILGHPETQRLLDFNKPTAVLFLSVLLFVTDDEEAYRIVRSVRDALVPGSYIAISHPTDDETPWEQGEQAKKLYAAIGTPVNVRSYNLVERFFEGLELVEPGLVQIPLWRPEGSDDLFLKDPKLSAYYAGVGRKPQREAF
jgi:O-methyltransferase involved in polyketide biosynthesis